MADIRGVANTNTLGASSNDAYRTVAVDRLGDLFTADLKGLASRAAAAGRLVVASDADQNDTITGQTSFANTTPTLLLNVPSGSCAVPLWVRLVTTGTVAGAETTVIVEVDDIAAYASGGTAETLFYVRNGAGFSTACAVYSGATATAGYGVSLFHKNLPADSAPAVTDIDWHTIVWMPDYVLPLVGPASLKVFTYAGTTGPTYQWSIGFLDVPAGMFTS